MAISMLSRALPRILLLIDKKGWAFDTIAQAIQKHASDRFSFEIVASCDVQSLDLSRFDLLHVFYFAERMHRSFLDGRIKVIKGVYSFRWQLAGLSSEELYREHLSEADAVSVPNLVLKNLLSGLPVPVFHTPEGVDTTLFQPASPRTGNIVFGFAGKTSDPVKQYPLLLSACESLAALMTADGSLPHEKMPSFYHDIDVLVCASRAEGSPRPLLEAMACGKFPVSFPVGIAREVIVHGVNGLIVEEATVEALRAALLRCKDHPDAVREASRHNAEKMQQRDWQKMIRITVDMYDSLLS